MTTATFVAINCPACGVTGTIPVDALLVSVAVDDSGDSCADLIAAQIDWPALLTLVTAGATLLDDGTENTLQPHPEHSTPGAPLSRDDLLALHELLASDTWFGEIATAG